MPLTVESFKRPAGRLNPTWFEEDDLDALLTAFITEAEGLTENEGARIAWVYHRAFQALADDRMLQPTTQAADDVREVYAPEQLAVWRGWASEYLAKFQALTGAASGGPVFTPIGFR